MVKIEGKYDDNVAFIGSCIGWMSPDGEIISCESWEHIDKAEEIIAERGYAVREKSRPDDFLYDNGWTKIAIVTAFGHGMAFYVKRPTEQQKQKIREIVNRIPDFIDKHTTRELQIKGVLPYSYDENGVIID